VVLATWAKRLSWQEVARVFRTSWDQVFRSVAMAVTWGRDHVDLAGIRAIGIDEIHWQRGGNFLTLGLSDRPDAQTLAVDRAAPTREDAAEVLPLVWEGAHRGANLHLQ
jgi:hypothetical protein